MAKRRRKSRSETRTESQARLAVIEEGSETIRVPRLASLSASAKKAKVGESTVDIRRPRPLDAGEETVRVPGLSMAPPSPVIVREHDDRVSTVPPPAPDHGAPPAAENAVEATPTDPPAPAKPVVVAGPMPSLVPAVALAPPPAAPADPEPEMVPVPVFAAPAPVAPIVEEAEEESVADALVKAAAFLATKASEPAPEQPHTLRDGQPPISFTEHEVTAPLSDVTPRPAPRAFRAIGMEPASGHAAPLRSIAVRDALRDLGSGARRPASTRSLPARSIPAEAITRPGKDKDAPWARSIPAPITNPKARPGTVRANAEIEVISGDRYLPAADAPLHRAPAAGMSPPPASIASPPPAIASPAPLAGASPPPPFIARARHTAAPAGPIDPADLKAIDAALAEVDRVVSASIAPPRAATPVPRAPAASPTAPARAATAKPTVAPAPAPAPAPAVVSHPQAPFSGGADPERLCGKILGGRFQIQRLIGRGGMGAVFSATQLSVGRTVAVKVLFPEANRDPALAARFVREARATAALRSPHTVTVHDFGSLEDGTMFLAMELISGKSLEEILIEEGAMQPERAAAILAQVCLSLDEAHAQGLLHRDLKPGNIMVESAGAGEHAKVVDFGLAKVLLEINPGVSAPGTACGTPAYMSPEQCRGQAAEIGPTADLYTLGIVFYRMLMGDVPFTGSELHVVMYKQIVEPPPPLAGEMEKHPLRAQCQALLDRCLAKSPQDRFASATELREAFLAIAAGGAPPESLLEATRRLAPRKPKGKLALAGACAAALMLTGAAVWALIGH